MIDNRRTYPSMKQSGCDWLGLVPDHWTVNRLKHLLREIGDVSQSGREKLLRVSQYTGVTERERRDSDLGPDHAPTPLIGYRKVMPGDLAVNIMLAWNGSMGVSRFEGVVSPAYCVYRFKERANPWFFHYLLRSNHLKSRIRVASTGIVDSRLRLYTDDLYRLEAPLPPLSEQDAIVRFLDHANLRIQRYVRAKEKLIALLEEQKQVVIHQAVTGEIDVRNGKPYPAYKDTGREELRSVPKHWQFRRLKSLVERIDQGVSPQADSGRLADGESYGVLKAGCVNGGVFREREHKRLPAGFVFDAGLAIAVGDVLVCRASGSPDLVGSVGRVPALNYRLIMSDKTFRPAFGDEVDPDFMVFAMNSHCYREQVQCATSGAEGLANNLPLSSLRRFYFPVPALDEQHQVVNYLQRAVGQLDDYRELVARQASILKEFQTRLVADVVTGKLDVRDAAAKLPNANGMASDGILRAGSSADSMPKDPPPQLTAGSEG